MVEVRTRYTLELYRDYFWFSLFRGKKYRQGKTAFHIISVLMFFLMICSFIWLDVVFTRAVTTAMSAICVLFYLMAFTRPKRYVKRSPVLFETDTEFVFNNDSFITYKQETLLTVRQQPGTKRYIRSMKQMLFSICI